MIQFKLSKLVILFFILLVTLCFTKSKIIETGIVGNYRGIKSVRGERLLLSLTIKADRHYFIRAMTNKQGSTYKATESGDWTLKGDILSLKNKTNSNAAVSKTFKFYNGNLWTYSEETKERMQMVFTRK